MDTEATYLNFFFRYLQQKDNLITVTVFEFTLPWRQHNKFESNQGKCFQFSELLHFAVRHSIFVMKLVMCVFLSCW
jgi:hypothetical protein